LAFSRDKEFSPPVFLLNICQLIASHLLSSNFLARENRKSLDYKKRKIMSKKKRMDEKIWCLESDNGFFIVQKGK